ncbi:putative gamma-secretase subunit PEN-2 [Haematococcus lacustris]|uniref:Putative gamma-secretase subunit PEN-2 n=1 Tax=Haematococcus lacustris TaxID=44745 RepID=A0A699ZT17_HAELA|nr:putative gamma-secretase subunit PEN-2 [Haematococcus lacustris]
MDSPEPVVESVDGELIAVHKAHKLARRMFVAGFFCLPLLWGFNVWLFWPDFRSGRDAVLSKFTRRSARGFTVHQQRFIQQAGHNSSAHQGLHRVLRTERLAPEEDHAGCVWDPSTADMAQWLPAHGQHCIRNALNRLTCEVP